MKTEFDLEYLLDNTGCYTRKHAVALYDVYKKEGELVTVEELLELLPLDDFCWFLSCVAVETIEEARELTVEIVKFITNLVTTEKVSSLANAVIAIPTNDDKENKVDYYQLRCEILKQYEYNNRLTRAVLYTLVDVVDALTNSEDCTLHNTYLALSNIADIHHIPNYPEHILPQFKQFLINYITKPNEKDIQQRIPTKQ